VLTADVKVKTNGTSIHVLTARGTVFEEIGFGGEAHRIRFQTLSNFVGGRTAQSVLSAVYQEQKGVHADELKDYVKSMEEMNLLGEGASRRMFTPELVNALASKFPITITTTFTLSREETDNMADWVQQNTAAFHLMALDHQIRAWCQIPVYAEAIEILKDRIVSGNLLSLIFSYANHGKRDVKQFTLALHNF